MRHLIIILSFLLISTIGLSQKIYTVLPSSKYIKYTFDKPNDSTIQQMYSYLNECRSDLVKTSKKIELNLSDYNQNLKPLVINDKLNREAQRRCEQYGEFYLNYGWTTHMFNDGVMESLISEYGNEIDYSMILHEYEKMGTEESKPVIEVLKKLVKSQQNPKFLINDLLLDDGNDYIVTGHRDMLLSKDDDELHNDQIGFGYVEKHFTIIENNKKVHKIFKFLVILIEDIETVNNIKEIEKNNFATIKHDSDQRKRNYINKYYELMNKRNTKILLAKK
jgi:hypothetical protein